MSLTKSNALSPFIILLAILFTSCSKVTLETKDNFEAVVLPDGSQVYLNRNSSVSYDKSFDPRNINLKGEAYFSVVPGENPFIVNTSLGEVKVLGTEFDVKAEAEELEVEVEEGVVNLKTKHDNSELKKAERAVYNDSKNAIEKGKAEFRSRAWIKELKMEFKKMGREFKKTGKEVGKEMHDGGKEMGKDLKKTGKQLRDAVK
jgi:transmembrane sensor